MQHARLGYPVGVLVAEPGVCSHVIIYILGVYADSIMVCLVFPHMFHIAVHDWVTWTNL